MAKIPTKQDGGKLPVSSTEYIKSASVRKKVAKLANKKSKTTPPKSKVKMQSEKPIPRKPARKMSYNATM